MPTDKRMFISKMKVVSAAFVANSFFIFVSDCQFLSGTISWMQESTNSIRFTNRLTWKKGFGPCGSLCSRASIGSSIKSTIASGYLSSLQWQYTDGNITGNLSDVSYYVTSVGMSSSFGWEQGENAVVFNGFQMNQMYTVHLDSIPWISSVAGNYSPSGYMETTVDLRLRSDTGKINNSPYASVQPYIGAAFGCTTQVRFPAADPDGDMVRCRWAEPSECGGACTNTPVNAVKLSKANCSIAVNAYNETGFTEDGIYRLTLVVEDFPYGAIDVGGEMFTRSRALSKVPLQITLRTSPAYSTCNNRGFRFVKSTPPNNHRYFTTPEKVKQLTLYRFFYLQTEDMNGTEFMASIPRFVKYDIKPDYYKRSNVMQLTTTWKPMTNQSGDQQICIWGLDANGVTTDSRCITEIISDIPSCSPGTCHNNGTCINLYNVTDDICDCPRGYKPPYCLNETICDDEPCTNNGTCFLNASKHLYSCSCERGYHGSDCEQETDLCVPQPCRNNGTCLDLLVRFLCLCLDIYTGNNCETDLNAASEDSAIYKANDPIKAWIPATAAAGGIAVITVLALFIYIKLKPKNSVSSEPYRTLEMKPAKSNNGKL